MSIKPRTAPSFQVLNMPLKMKRFRTDSQGEFRAHIKFTGTVDDNFWLSIGAGARSKNVTHSFNSKASCAAEILACGFLSLQAFCMTVQMK